MIEFDDFNDLFAYCDKTLNTSLHELGEVFKITLHNFVKEKFYDMYTPKFYERTWEVLNSITLSPIKQEDGLATVEVFFDTTKINPRISTFDLPPGMTRFHHHMDNNGNPVSDIIVFIINEGWNMGTHGYRQGGRFLEAMETWSNNKNNWIGELNRILKEKGIEVV